MRGSAFLPIGIAMLCGLVLLGANLHAQDVADPNALWREATLYRDEWGVPHVYAATPRALGFAFGYAQAEDHLEAMLLSYRMARGQAAAVLGEAYAESDAWSRRLGHGRLAANALPALDAEVIALCEGFAFGVNAWIAEHPAECPVWVEGVHPADPLALWHAYVMAMAPVDAPGVYWPARPLAGKSWALAPWRMVEEEAMLVIAPYQNYESAFQWYEAHLSCGNLDVSGATLRGLPVIVQGHNGLLGWGLNPNRADTADTAEEHLPDIQGGQAGGLAASTAALSQRQQAYMLQYLSQHETVYVRTPEGMREDLVPVYQTSLGPVLENAEGRLFSWRAGGYGEFGAFRQLIDMASATHREAFQQALSYHQLPGFHVVQAGREDAAFYFYAAKTGARNVVTVLDGVAARLHPDWQMPSEPNIVQQGWVTLVPLANLPRMETTPNGFVVAGGNPPWLATYEGFVPLDLYPPWLARDEDSLAARRLRRLLSAGTKSWEMVAAPLFDTFVPAAQEAVPLLLSQAEENAAWLQNAHPDLSDGLNLLADWDYTAEVGSRAMTFFHVWWSLLLEQAADHGLTPIEFLTVWGQGDGQAQGLAFDTAAAASRMLRNEFQEIAPKWGDVHRILRGNRDEPMPGSDVGGAVFAMDDRFYAGQRWPARQGLGFAMAVSFGERVRAESLSPFGASNRPGSPHYSDQLDRLLQGRLKPARFYPEEVWRFARNARGRRIEFQPPGVEGSITLFSATPIEARLLPGVTPSLPFPQGKTPFSLCIQPDYQPVETPVRAVLEIYIPEVLCAADDLIQLAVYTPNPQGQWTPLPGQSLDADTRLLLAEHAGSGPFVVLGPEACFLPSQEKNDTPEGEEDSPEETPQTEAVPVETEAPEGE
jgi:acyl-homoserine-lactone acylase